MAPTRTVRSKVIKTTSSPHPKSSSTTSSRKSAKPTPAKPARPRSARVNPHVAKMKKRRVYSAEELGVPTLNMVTPAGVQAPKGKKRGKVFVDDRESMMTILAMVNADKEGQIESKMMKARQMEEIREARRKEAEVRQEAKRSKFEDTKASVRKSRKRKSSAPDGPELTKSSAMSTPRKRVAFA